MWETLIKIQKSIQRIRPLRIQYSPASDQFYENHSIARKTFSSIIDSNLVVIWVTSFAGLKSAFSVPEDSEQTVQQQVLGIVLQVLFVGLFSLLLGCVWTFKYRGSQAVWLMNQAKRYYDERPPPQTSDNDKKSIPVFEILLYGMVGICIVGALTAGLTPILSSHTPPQLILSKILPQGHLDRLGGPLLTLICCIYLTTFAIHGSVSCLQVLMYMCGILYETQFMLKPAYIQKKFKIPLRSSFSRMKGFYMQSFIFVQEYNTFGYLYFPLVMTTGFVINVVTSLICIEFNSDLNPLLVGCFAGFDLICAGLTLGIHSFAMISSEEGDKFHRFWNCRLFSKSERKHYRACMPITVEIGPFFVLQRCTLLNTTSETVNATVSLLIMDD